MTIELTHRATYHGPNPFSTDPVVVVEVAVSQALASEAPRLVAELAALSAPWFDGREGDDSQKPGEVQLASALVRWSLGALTFVRGYLHAAGVQAPTSQAGMLTAWLGFHDPNLSLETLKMGARLLQALSKEPVPPARFESALSAMWNACRKVHPDFQARILMEAARAMDVPYTPAWGQARHWQFGQGSRSRVMFETSSVEDSAFGARMSASKEVGKAALVALGLPTPVHVLVREELDLEAAVLKVGFPCVTKPLNLGSGKGVSAGHQTLADVQSGFREARAVSAGAVMVESFLFGDDHRLVVVDGVLRVAIRRDPACALGDGSSTVRELVAAQNILRDARGLVFSGYLRPIKLDEPALRCLSQQGVGLDTVLAAGRHVKLRSNANGATGGHSTDVTAMVHPHVRTMAETLARTLNIRAMGADYLTTDFSRSPSEVGGAFIEFNTTPGLAVLMVAGWSAVAAGRLVLGDSIGRIALDLLLVPDVELGAFTSALAETAWPSSSGWASAEQATLAGVTLQVRLKHPWAGIRTLLAHRCLERALLLCGLEQLERHGLPADRLKTVYVGGVTPNEEWQRVLEQTAEHVSMWPDARSALRAHGTTANQRTEVSVQPPPAA